MKIHKVIAVSMALALSACASTTAYVPPQPHLNRVSAKEVTQNFYFEYDEKKLSPREAVYLEKVLEGVDPAAVEQVVISGTGKESSLTEADRKLLKKRLGAMEKAFLSRGVPSDRIVKDSGEGSSGKPFTSAAPQSTGSYYQAVHVQLVHYQVQTPDCPNWTQPTPGNRANLQHSNWGCATVSNMGRMVQNPGDLVMGRGESSTSAASAARPVVLYGSGYSPDAASSGGDSGGTTSNGGGGAE